MAEFGQPQEGLDAFTSGEAWPGKATDTIESKTAIGVEEMWIIQYLCKLCNNGSEEALMVVALCVPRPLPLPCG